eukprot:3513754-Karenia_brevis.AAC.1
MQKLNHPNLPTVYEFYEVNRVACIELEFYSGGDLWNKIIDRGSFSVNAESNSTLHSNIDINTNFDMAMMITDDDDDDVGANEDDDDDDDDDGDDDDGDDD